jgi:hypothetical protein
MRKVKMYTGLWCGNLRKTGHLVDPGLDGRIILKWTYRTCDLECGIDRCGSEYGQVAGTCECGKESSGSIKCGEILD